MGVRATLLGLALALVCVPAARAAAPIMPLSEVKPGMRCTGLSVVRGTSISRFRVDVVDVVAAGLVEDARILVRVSGPAVDRSGIAAGFSGSPIYCPDAKGVQRNAGAISEGLGEYGDHEGLATPIEQVLGQRVKPPAGARRVPAGRPLTGPLSVSGVTGPLAGVLKDAARRAGRTVIAVPGGATRSFPVQDLRPGASFSAGFSSGAIAYGAIGTVSYRRGDQVWGFGHELDAAGRRGLLLQDAFVYDVIDSPLGAVDAPSYKLADPGHNVGTLTGDGGSGVAGRLGALPDRTAVRVAARDPAGAPARSLESTVADEGPLGYPVDGSALQLITSLSLSRATVAALGGAVPTRATASMCLRITVRERNAPMRFCNRYLTGSGGFGGLPGLLLADLSSDAQQAIATVQAFRFGPLHITGVEASVRAGSRLRQTFMSSIRAPRRVRAGQRIRVVVRARDVDGGTRRVGFRLTVPGDLKPGIRTLTLTGTGTDEPESDFTAVLGHALLGDTSTDLGLDSNDPGPRTLDDVADEVSSLRRFDGVRASFDMDVPDVTDPFAGLGSPDSSEPGLDVLAGGAGEIFGDPVFRSKRLRISGQVSLEVRVKR